MVSAGQLLLLAHLLAGAGAMADYRMPQYRAGPAPGMAGFGSNETAREVADAIGNPGLSRTMTFQPFTWYRPTSASNPLRVELARMQWKWRVNVTKYPLVHLPPSSGADSQPVTDPYSVATSFDLSWPVPTGGGGGNATLATALGNSSGPVCATFLTANTMPRNVSNGYPVNYPDTGEGCSLVLSRACISALRRSGSSPSVNGLEPQGGRPRCQPPPEDWGRVPECEAYLSHLSPVGGRASAMVQTIDLNQRPAAGNGNSSGNSSNNSSSSSSSGPQVLRSGGNFLVKMEAAVSAAGADDAFHEAAGQLHILLLDFTGARLPGIDQDKSRDAGMRPQLLCLRVNATHLPVKEPENAAKAIVASPISAVFAAAGLGVLLPVLVWS